MTTTVQGQFRDSALLSAMVANRHPKLRSWLDSGALVRVEYVRVDHSDSTVLYFSFANGQKLAIQITPPPKHGSMFRKDQALLDSIRSTLTEENIAKLALMKDLPFTVDTGIMETTT